MEITETTLRPRRWVVLAVAFFVTFTGGYNQFLLSGFASEVVKQLGLTSSQLASLVLAPMVPGIFLGLVGGGLSDRFGVKKVIGVAFIISLVGSILRPFATNYPVMFIAMLLIGMGALFLGFSAAKLLGSWAAGSVGRRWAWRWASSRRQGVSVRPPRRPPYRSSRT